MTAITTLTFFAGFAMGLIYGWLARPSKRYHHEPAPFDERILQSWRAREEAMVRAAREMLPQGPSSRKHPIVVPVTLLRQLYALYLEDIGGRHLSVLNYSFEDRREGPGKVIAFTAGRWEPNGTVWLSKAPPS